MITFSGLLNCYGKFIYFLIFRERGGRRRSLLSLPLLIKTHTLLDWGPTLVTSFSLNYLPTPNTGVGKGRFTVVHMENNITMNNNIRISSLSCVITTGKLLCCHSIVTLKVRCQQMNLGVSDVRDVRTCREFV